MDISSMLEVQVKEVKEIDSKENVSPKAASIIPCAAIAAANISQEEKNFYNLMFGNDIASVRHLKLHCTACDAHIGSAPVDAHNMFEHPILKTLLCAECREFYGDGDFEQGDDATDMFCRWCANGGNLYCCSYCSNTFCSKCIKRNFDPVVRKKIEADEKWKCFVCNPLDLFTLRAICWALLQHVQTVTRILQSDPTMTPKQIEEKMHLDDAQCCSRKRKRNRRSYSEDEDETYSPSFEEAQQRRRSRRSNNQQRKSLTNGSTAPSNKPNARNSPVPILPKEAAYNSIDEMDNEDLPPPPLLCEQTMIEGEGQTVTPDGSVVPATENNVVAKKSIISLKPVTSIPTINAVPTANLLQTVVLPSQQLRKIKLIPLGQSDKFQKNKPNPFAGQKELQRIKLPLAPMVSIPVKRPKVHYPIQRNKVNSTTASQVIDLDSDSDDAVIVDSPATNPKKPKNAVPIALVTSGGGTKGSEGGAKSGSNPFLKMLLSQDAEMNLVLSSLKSEMAKILQPREKQEDVDVHKKVKRFHRELRKSMIKLSEINDRVLREYKNFKDKKESQDSEDPESRDYVDDVTEVTGLEMVCTRDSCGSETSSTGSRDDREDFTLNSNIDEIVDRSFNVTLFKRNDTCERGVGESNVCYESKGVQVDEDIWKDCERCIGYSLLSRKKREEEKDEDDEEHPEGRNTSSDSVKFQEQFIFHLQHIEDFGIETEETKYLSDEKREEEERVGEREVPPKDLLPDPKCQGSRIEEPADTCEELATITPIVELEAQEKAKEGEMEDSGTGTTGMTMEVDVELEKMDNSTTATPCTSKAVEELAKMVTKLTDDLNADKLAAFRSQSDTANSEFEETSEGEKRKNLEEEEEKEDERRKEKRICEDEFSEEGGEGRKKDTSGIGNVEGDFADTAEGEGEGGEVQEGDVSLRKRDSKDVECNVIEKN